MSDDTTEFRKTQLGQCEQDVQKRMVWHFLLVHDDFGTRVGASIGIAPSEVQGLPPLPGQELTDDDQRRLRRLGNNGDVIDETVWGQWTSSVKNHPATAEEVLSGQVELPHEERQQSRVRR